MIRSMKALLVGAVLIAGLASTAGVASAAPANDNFANATPISGTSGTATGSNVAATRQTGEPDITSAAGKTVWFRWVAPNNGRVSFDTFGSSFDTTVGIFNGGAVNSLMTLDTNNDARDQDTSRAFTAVTAGTTYRIQVSGFSSSDTGSLRLAWRYIARPANDNFVNAQVLTGASPTASGSLVGATAEAGEPTVVGYLSNSVWYRWTATFTGDATFDTVASEPDTVLGVFTGAAVNSLTQLGTDDDGGSGFHDSLVEIPVTNGVVYSIKVDGYGDDNGAIRMRVNGPTFLDVPFSHPMHDAIEWTYEDGTVNGFPDGTFRPGNPVSRAAISSFLYNFNNSPYTGPGSPTFSDVPLSHPFYDEIEWMNDQGITTGYPDGTFRPSLQVNRAAASAFLYRMQNEPAFPLPGSPTFSDVPLSHPFREAIEWAYWEGITTGYPGGLFKPGAAVSRGAMATFIYRLEQE